MPQGEEMKNTQKTQFEEKKVIENGNLLRSIISFLDVFDCSFDDGIPLLGSLLPGNLMDGNFDVISIDGSPKNSVEYAWNNLFFNWKDLIQLTPFVILGIILVDLSGMLNSLIDKFFIFNAFEVGKIDVFPTTDSSSLDTFLLNVDIVLGESCNEEKW